MTEKKIPYSQFASDIKSKYPQYRDVDDLQLSKDFIAKYPTYGERVELGNTTPAQPTTESQSLRPAAGGNLVSSGSTYITPSGNKTNDKEYAQRLQNPNQPDFSLLSDEDLDAAYSEYEQKRSKANTANAELPDWMPKPKTIGSGKFSIPDFSGMSEADIEAYNKMKFQADSKHQGVVLDELDEDSQPLLREWSNRQQKGVEKELEGLRTRFDDLKENGETSYLDRGNIDWLLTNTEETLNKPSRYDDTSFLQNTGNYFKGFGNKISDRDTWTFGMTEIARNVNTANIFKRLEKGEELQSDEELLLAAFVTNMAANNLRAEDVALAYQAGEGLAQSVPFMAEFALLGGLSSVGKKAVLKAVSKNLGKRSASMVGKYLESGLLKHTAGTAAMTAAMPTTYAEMSGSILDSVIAGEEYEFKDFVRDFTNSFVENTTERFIGNSLDKGFGAVGKVLLGDKAKGLTKFGEAWHNNKYLKDIPIDSPVTEMLEEYAGAGINYLRSFNPLYSDESNEEMRKEAEHLFSADGAAIMAGSVLPMTILPIAFGMHKNSRGANNEEKLRNIIRQGIENTINDITNPVIPESIDIQDPYIRTDIGTATANALRAMEEALSETTIKVSPNIAAGSLEEQKEILSLAYNSEDLTPEQKHTVGVYLKTAALQRKIQEQQAEISYNDGYNLSEPGQMNDARNLYNYRLVQAGSLLDNEALSALLDSDANEALSFINSNGNLTEVQKEAAIDIVNAKQAYTGMMQRVEDNITRSIEESNATIDVRTNNMTGRVLSATMKQDDRKVHIVSGTPVAYPDGTGVDITESGNSIIVRDDETGDMDQVSPDALLSIDEEQDPVEQKELTAEAIRQQFTQEATNKIDGVVMFNPGDTHIITGEDGNQVQVQIAANEQGIVDNGDGTINVSDGASVVPMSKDFIQQETNAVNMSRIAEFEQQRAEEAASRKLWIAQQEKIQAEAKEANAMPEYALEDKMILLDDKGNETKAEIVSKEGDGVFVVDVSSPIKGRYSANLTADEINDRLVEHKGKRYEKKQAVVEEQPTIPTNSQENASNTEQSVNTTPSGDNKVSEEAERQAIVAEIKKNAPKQNNSDEIDYDALLESNPAAFAALYESEEGTEETVRELAAVSDNIQKRIDSAKKKLESADSINKRKSLRQEITGLQERKNNIDSIIDQYAPKEESTQETVENQDVQDVADPLLVIAENSTDLNEILSAYNEAMQSAGEETLKDWEKQLIGRKVNRSSFQRFGDRNHINGAISHSWFNRKDEESVTGTIDTIAEELGVTEQDIIDFILDPPNNRIKNGNDLTKALNNRFKEIASGITGQSVGGIESGSGKLLMRALQYADSQNREVETNTPLQDVEIPDSFLSFVEASEIDLEAINSFDELIESIEESNKNGLFSFPLSPEDYTEILNFIDNARQNETYARTAKRSQEAISERSIRTNLGEQQEAGRGTDRTGKTPGISSGGNQEVDENGRPFIKANNGTTIFGEIREDSGLTPAPIKLSKGYQDSNGKGYGLAHIEANHGEQIRNTGFASVEEFVSYVAENYDSDNIRVGKRRPEGSSTFLIQITDIHDNTLFVELSKDESYWNVNSGGVFRKGYSNKKETVAKTEPQQPKNVASSGSSLSEDTKDIASLEPNSEPTVSDTENKGIEQNVQNQENPQNSNETIFDEKFEQLSTDEIRVVENHNSKLIEEAFIEVENIPLKDRYTAFVEGLKRRGVPNEVIQEINSNEESDLYLELQNTLSSVMGEQEFDKWTESFAEQRWKLVFSNIKTQINPNTILKEKGQSIDFGNPVYDNDYFGFTVTKKGNKYNVSVRTKSKGGVFYNPFYTQLHEGVTLEKAREIIESEAQRMIRIGTPIPTLSEMSKKLNSTNNTKTVQTDPQNSNETIFEQAERIAKNLEIAEARKEEAREAYLSNYEEGWQGLGNITETSIESFREWADMDGRRIKPFAEYKNNQKEDIPIMTEEGYLASKGYSSYGIGEVALHKGKQRTKKLQDKEVERQAEKDKEYVEKREELRKEYADKVANGEIRPPSKIEALIKTANGHEDNESTHVARRLLAKRGVDWRDSSAQESEIEQIKQKSFESEGEYTDKKINEYLQTNKISREEFDESDEFIDVENSIVDSYPAYIKELRDSGALQKMYDAAAIGEEIKIRKGIEAAGFELADVVDTSKKKEARKSNKKKKGKTVQELRNLGVISMQTTDNRFKPISKRAFNKLISKLKKTGLTKDVVTDKAKFKEMLEKSLGKENADRFMTLWHGSPHNFEKFSLAYRGTGEGNEAFGPGLYFSNSKDIAEYYATFLSMPQYMLMYKGKEATDTEKAAHSLFTIHDAKSIPDAIEKAEEARDAFKEDVEITESYNAIIEVLKNSKESDFEEVDVNKGTLYKIDTIDDLNLIDWYEPLPRKQREALIKGIENLPDYNEETDSGVDPQDKEYVIDSIRGGIVGGQVQGTIEYLLGNGESDAYMQFMRKAGFQGVRYPADSLGGRESDAVNYVIFDENAIEISDKIKLMATPQGEVYGFVTPDGMVYLDPDKMNANTPIHEFGHLWNSFIKENNPELWKKGSELIKNSPYWDAVNNNPAYRHLPDEAKIDEAIAMAIGDKGEAMMQNKDIFSFAGIKAWLFDVWNWAKKKLGIVQSINIEDMTLEDFTSLATEQLLGEKNIANKEISNNFANDENARADTEKISSGVASSEVREAQGGINDSIEENAGDALLAGAMERADRKVVSNTRANKSEQEKLLKDYAKETDSWLNESDISNNSSEKFPSGKEANVYLSQDKTHVTKIVNYDKYSDTPLDFMRNRISLFNELFPNTQYKLLGFTENNKGFAFVVEQPAVKGVELSDIATSVPALMEQQDRIAQYLLEKYGMEPAGLDSYSNGEVTLQDIHLKNVMEDADGNLYFIDVIPSYNQPNDDTQHRDDDQGTETSPTPAQRKQMASRVKELTEKLNLDNVETVTNRNGLEGKNASAKGFYTKSADKITIVIPNNTSIADVEQTLLHEAVAHHGLRKLFGGHFDTFLDNVFNNADESVRKGIVGLAAKNNWDFRKATEEYLAKLAENTEFENAKETSWWNKIKEFFSDMLRSIGFTDFSGVTLTDNELRYILWRSYENLKEGKRSSLFGEAADIAKQFELGVGEFSTTQNDVLHRDGEHQIQSGVETPLPEYPKQPNYKDYNNNMSAFLSDYEKWKQETRKTDLKLSKEAREAIDEVSGFITNQVDSQAPIEALLKYIDKNGGKVTEQSDAYNYYFLSKGAATDAIKRFEEKEIKNLAKAYNRIIHTKAVRDLHMERLEKSEAKRSKHDKIRDKANKRNVGFELDEYEKTSLYLQAKDIQEAKEKKLPDRGEQAFIKTFGMIHTDYIEKFEKAAGPQKINNLWETVNAATKFSLDIQYKNGLIDKETYDKYNGRKYYVPERGWNEREVMGDETHYLSNHGSVNNNPYNSALVKAKGRDSLAADPIPYIQSIATSSVLSVFKNNTKQRALNLVVDNLSFGKKHNLFDFKQIFYIDTGKTDADGNKLYEEVYERPEKKLFKDGKVEVRSGGISVDSRTRAEKSQHGVFVTKDGIEYVLQFTDERVANALNRNTENDELNGVAKTVSKGTRAMSAMMTQYNPKFALWNLVRDTGTGIVSNLGEHGLGFTAKFLSKGVYPRYHSAIINYLTTGKFTSSKYGQYLDDFFRDGAATGWSFMKDVDQLKKDFKKMADPSFAQKLWGGKFGLANFAGLKSLFGSITEYSELMVRFAQYCTARDAGMSKQVSATQAKEISVNFDRKGDKQLLKPYFGFWNATIQGTNKFARLHTKNKKTAAVLDGVLLSMVVGGFLNTLFQPDDPDEERVWGEYDRIQNFVIGHIKIPLPHFIRAFWGLGVQTALAMQGNKTSEKAIYDGLIQFFDEMLPLNAVEMFVGFDEDANSLKLNLTTKEGLRPIVPTVAVPLYDIGTNSTFSGSTVYREPFSRGQDEDIPQSFLGKKNVAPWAQAVSNWLFDAGGGNSDIKSLWTEKGKASEPLGKFQNPSSIEHFLKGYIPGVGGFISEVATTLMEAPDWVKGKKEFDPTVVPVLNRAVKPYREDKVFQNKYYSLKDMAEGYEHGYKARIKAATEGVLDLDKVQEEANSDAYQLWVKSLRTLYKLEHKLELEKMNKEDIKEMDELIKSWRKIH